MKRLIVLVIVISLAYGVCATAESQIPTPAPLKTSKPQQQYPSQPQPPRNNVTSVPNTSAVIVKKNVPLPSEKHLPNNSEASNGHTSAHRWNWGAISSVISAIATAVIAGFTISLARSTKKLWEETKSSIEIARNTAQAAQKSAEAAELTAQAALGAELPRFVVTDMVLRQGTDSPYATITLTNHGRTEAVITGECLIFQKTPSLPPKPRYPVGAQKLIDFGKTVKSGESHQIGALVSSEDITGSPDGSNYFIIWGFGFIVYRDFLGKNHTVGFVGGASIPSNTKGVIMAIDGINFQQQGPSAYTYSN